MAEKNGFDITKLIFQERVCGSMVQWSGSYFMLAPAEKPGSYPGDAIFCFFVSFVCLFFFCVVFGF